MSKKSLRPGAKKSATRNTVAIAVASLMAVSLAACADDNGNNTAASETSETSEDGTGTEAFHSRLDGSDSPMLAQGVVIPHDVDTFKTSGIGPSALNEDAEEGDPMAFVDPELLVDGELPDGMTITEAQGLNTLAEIRDLLQAEGLDVQDVATMRVFLGPGPDGEEPDFEGWNRAYRQYFANTDLSTGEPMQVTMGADGAEQDPMIINSTRPSRFALGIFQMPVDGWLVEVEVDAYFKE